MVRLILITILLVLLTSCSTVGIALTNKLVRKALTLQLSQTQQPNQQLKPVVPLDIEIARLKITERQQLLVENLPIYRV